MSQIKSLFIILFIATLASCSAENANEQSQTVATENPANSTESNNSINGTVTSDSGPEAGVWVIAETHDLGTRFARIVVTDDQGRYLLPDMPEASFDIWVRGYGLVDSEKVSATPGDSLDLEAVLAPSAADAAEYYPASYWYSLLEIPEASEFPGTGPTGNGISTRIEHQADYVRLVTNGGCIVCHQIGNKATRELPALFNGFDTSSDAWSRRIQSGQAGGFMTRTWTSMGIEHVSAMYGDWTDRIAAGELPPIPERPQGLERNVVITQWDWADPTAYLHDVVSTDRRNPTINGYGKLYGALEESADYLPVLDPVTHTIDQVPLTMMDPEAGPVGGPPLALLG